MPFCTKTLIGRASPCSLICCISVQMKERHLGSRLKQRETGTQHWLLCEMCAVLIRRVLHPGCENRCLFLGHSWSPLHAYFVLHIFFLGFMIYAYCRRVNLTITVCLKRQYANTWMLTRSLYFLILRTRGTSEEKQLPSHSEFCWRPMSRTAVLLRSCTPVSQRHVDIPVCQTRQRYNRS